MSFPSASGGTFSYLPHLGLISLLCALLLLPQPAEESPVLASPPPAAAPAANPLPVLIDTAHPLDPSFTPPDLTPAGSVLLSAEAAGAFNAMAQEALAAGVVITTASGYRSFQDQESLHGQYTLNYGQDRAREISAQAGTSEHQSGLAVDIANPDGACALQACFSQTPAGSWAAEHGWRFGFIIRYPQGAESVTGYAYEPWHLRYVGPVNALAMRDTGAPILENFLNTPKG